MRRRVVEPHTVPCQVEASVESGAPKRLAAPELQPGDLVRVRPASEIAATLDGHGRLRGCAFGAGMLAECGTQRRVLKRVEHIFDEYDHRLVRVHNVVYLEGSTCDGTARPGGCDYACQFAWRTEWLEKQGQKRHLELAPPTRDIPWLWQLRDGALRARHALGALLRHRPPRKVEPARAVLPPADLRPGDRVRVRSEEEIRSTLDSAGCLKGCRIGTGQLLLCGKELRVLRRVEHFYDVGKGRMVRSHDTVLLEGVYCHGDDIPESRGCDRMCHYFWRTEWLQAL